MRDSMVIYRSFFDAIKDLDKNTQAEVWNAVFEYGMNFKETDLQGVSKAIFTLIKPNIDANIRKYENGNKPKVKQEISKPEANTKLEVSKPEANTKAMYNVDVDKECIKVDAVCIIENENKNVNKKVDIESRKLAFAETIKNYIPEFDRVLLLDFYHYWSEENQTGTKMRYELEKTWNLAGRIRNWKKNESKFDKSKPSIFGQKPTKMDGLKSEYQKAMETLINE
jgi:hypothetical protein